MEKPLIVPIRVGYSNSVLLVNGSNSVLIDTGVKGHIQHFKKLFKQHHLKPEDIKLIVLTHTHYDHTGNLKELVKYTGAKVLVHKNEFNNLKNGFIPIPKGVSFKTRFVAELARLFTPKYASPEPFAADFTNENEFDLNKYGIDAKVISTPGHTSGSQSIRMGDTLISGDTFINLKNGTIFPHFVNEPEVLLKTWQNLYNSGVKVIYPGHGPKMKVEKTFPEFEKWKKKYL
jgi:hydroxyacylglutathione hydrolase